jgi:hypothetical protein
MYCEKKATVGLFFLFVFFYGGGLLLFDMEDVLWRLEARPV